MIEYNWIDIVFIIYTGYMVLFVEPYNKEKSEIDELERWWKL